ncbi:hypothetical protein M1146_04030 [Patescibacteria group bacterium]|nr:hypothetical protein [Patescibacteria group bacterium]
MLEELYIEKVERQKEVVMVEMKVVPTQSVILEVPHLERVELEVAQKEERIMFEELYLERVELEMMQKEVATMYLRMVELNSQHLELELEMM